MMFCVKFDIRFGKDLAIVVFQRTLLRKILEHFRVYDLALVLGLPEDHLTEFLFQFGPYLRVKKSRIDGRGKIGDDRIVLIKEIHLVIPELIGSI